MRWSLLPLLVLITGCASSTSPSTSTKGEPLESPAAAGNVASSPGAAHGLCVRQPAPWCDHAPATVGYYCTDLGVGDAGKTVPPGIPTLAADKVVPKCVVDGATAPGHTNLCCSDFGPEFAGPW